MTGWRGFTSPARRSSSSSGSTGPSQRTLGKQGAELSSARTPAVGLRTVRPDQHDPAGPVLRRAVIGDVVVGAAPALRRTLLAVRAHHERIGLLGDRVVPPLGGVEHIVAIR